MAFNGKLLELKTNDTYVEFPLKYIKAESYEITPNQRMETSANRATSGKLVRTTVQHTPSKIEFETTALTNAEIKDINDKLSAAYSDSLQRKLKIRYYVPETDDYKYGDVYVPDIQYSIMRIDKTNLVVHYNSVRFAFIEY